VTSPTDVWERFARKATPRRATNAAGADTWLNWTQYPDHGPDESVLGPLAGKRVVELGSGAGANLAHLATLGADCVGVDIAPTRTATANHTWANRPGVRFVTADALDHLDTHPNTYDIAYSIFGAVWFTDPRVLLPAIHRALRPGGTLAFSHLPPSSTPPPADRVITQQHLPPQQWTNLLDSAGFTRIAVEFIPPPATHRTGTLLGRATRR